MSFFWGCFVGMILYAIVSLFIDSKRNFLLEEFELSKLLKDRIRERTDSQKQLEFCKKVADKLDNISESESFNYLKQLRVEAKIALGRVVGIP